MLYPSQYTASPLYDLLGLYVLSNRMFPATSNNISENVENINHTYVPCSGTYRHTVIVMVSMLTFNTVINHTMYPVVAPTDTLTEVIVTVSMLTFNTVIHHTMYRVAAPTNTLIEVTATVSTLTFNTVTTTSSSAAHTRRVTSCTTINNQQYSDELGNK